MNRRGRRSLLAGCVLVLSLTATLVAFVVVRGWDRERVRADFDRLAERKAAALDRALSDAMDVFEALRDLHVSTDFGPDEFRQFVRRPLTTKRAVRTVIWAPRVAHAERVRWERAVPGHGLGISQFDASRRAVRASVRDSYFPIQYREPRGVHPVGFDLTSDPDVARGLARALASEAGVAVVEDSDSLVVVLPVYRNVQRQSELAGAVVGRLSVKEAIESSLGDSDDDDLRLALRRGVATGSTATLGRGR